jgi:rhodanese-related sulfurtransferase
MRNLSLGTVQFTHKIKQTAGAGGTVRHIGACTILVHSHQYALLWCAMHWIATPERRRGPSMSKTEEILAQARERAPGQPYAGAVTPAEAYELLQSDPRVKLVDVRTAAERDWVGRVAVPETQHAAVQWNLYPGGVPNPDFASQLSEVAGRDDVLLFLCRSGVRSRHAARVATEIGYPNAFDILEGFEGDRDAEGHRKTVGGWCKAGLPWVGA